MFNTSQKKINMKNLIGTKLTHIIQGKRERKIAETLLMKAEEN